MKRLRRITAVILAMVMVLSTMTNVFAAKDDNKFNLNTYNKVSIGIKTSDGAKLEAITSIKCRNKNSGSWGIELVGSFKPQKINNEIQYTSINNNNPKIEENTQFKITAVLSDGTTVEDIIIKNIANYPVQGKSFYEYCHENYNYGKNDKVFDIIYEINRDYLINYSVKYENGEENCGADTVKKGTEYTVREALSKEGYDFVGWSDGKNTYNPGDKVDVTKDITLKAVWKEKLYTVAYTVEEGVTGLPEGAEELKKGDVYTIPSTEPTKEGYTFVGWSYNNKTYSKGDKIIVGINNIELKAVWEKLYTVKFVNGEEVVSSTYKYGEKVNVPTENPTKEDEITNDSTGAAKWSKFTFKGWEAKGNYNVTDEVTQDMTFEATYTKKNVDVYFFVLNRGTAQKEEPGSYSSSDYSKGVKGTLKSFEAVNNNDERVKELICDAPEAADFGIELKEGESIKWYVIKPINNGEKWHVDGIIVGQTYNVTVECIDAKTDEVIETKTISVVATEDYNINLSEIEGYELVDKDTTVSGIMPYKNVKETVKYQKKTYTVTYKVDGEEYETFTVEYGKEIPASTYEVPEG